MNQTLTESQIVQAAAAHAKCFQLVQQSLFGAEYTSCCCDAPITTVLDYDVCMRCSNVTIPRRN